MEGESAIVKFTPEAGETTGFVSFELGGGSCPLAGTPIVPKGVVYAKPVNKTGVFATNQEVAFSPTINSAAGGSLKVGEKTATLEGRIICPSFGEIVIGESPYFGVK